MKLKKEKLTEALALLGAEMRIIAPIDGGNAPRFVDWDGKEALRLDMNALLPPKDTLFPPSEDMYAYDLKGGGFTETLPGDKQAIFGIRPCDVRSILNLDHAFLEKGYEDSYYLARRKNTALIALACTQAAPTCFCQSMGGNPGDAPGADLLLVDSGDYYEVRVAGNTDSAKKDADADNMGDKITKLWSSLLEDGEAAPAVSTAECTLKANVSADLPERLVAKFEDGMWEKLSKACLGCGCCTYVCPTCYCFDISKENRGAEGTAFRCWDSCMFSDYSRMAGGHNPRPSKRERLRNRYLHKLAYFNQRYGEYLCVGCGRCINKCPANLDITKVIDMMEEVGADGR